MNEDDFIAARKTEIIDLEDSTFTCANTLPDFPTKLTTAAGGLISDTPVICGGYNGGSAQRPCYKYDSGTGWTYMYDMISPRHKMGMFPLGNILISITQPFTNR